jgi:hypothetical protein
MRSIHVRRNHDGSIDFDFYRRRAARLRSKKVGKSVKGIASMIRPLIATALLLGMLLAMPTRAPEAPGRAADVAATERLDTPKTN